MDDGGDNLAFEDGELVDVGRETPFISGVPGVKVMSIEVGD